MTAIEFNHAIVGERVVLKSFAYNLTQNADRANDLVQDTYLKALMYKDKFQESTNLRAWLHTIMKNTFINDYRKNKKALALSSEKESNKNMSLFRTVSHNNPDEQLIAKEIVAEIGQLSEQYKTPFIQYYNGYQYDEIAEQLQLPLGTVKSRIFLARKALMSKIKQ